MSFRSAFLSPEGRFADTEKPLESKRPSSANEIKRDPPTTKGKSVSKASSYEDYSPESVQLKEIQRQYHRCLTLTNDITDISTSKAKAESGQTDGLTFSKIAKDMPNHLFRLQTWGAEVRIEDISGFEKSLSSTAEMVVMKMGRLEKFLRRLKLLCDTCTFEDLKDREEVYGEEDEDKSDLEDGTEHSIPFRELKDPPGVEIKQLLSSIASQLRTLSLLSEPLQYSTTPNPMRRAFTDLVIESKRYFGTNEAIRKYSVDKGLFGAEALRAAKESSKANKTIEKQKALDSDQDIEEIRRKLGIRESSNTDAQSRPGQAAYVPTFVKVHRDHISAQTLDYFKLDWEFDKVTPDYFLIKEELQDDEMDMLFNYERELRTKRGPTLHQNLVDYTQEKPDMTFVRRRQTTNPKVSHPFRRRSFGRDEVKQWQMN